MSQPVHLDVMDMVRFIRMSEAVMAAAERSAIKQAVTVDARPITVRHLKDTIDRPTPFTTSRSAVQAFTVAGGTRGVVRIAPMQAEYLGILEHGEEGEQLAQPIGIGPADKYGNVRRRFFRTPASKAALASSGKFFVGMPRGGKERGMSAGIYERLGKGGKMRQVVKFVQSRRYAPRLDLIEEWSRRIPPALMSHFLEQLRHQNAAN